MFEGIVSGIDAVVESIQSVVSGARSLFSDIDFTILYDWLPADIQAVITACIVILFILAIFGLIKRIAFFL